MNEQMQFPKTLDEFIKQYSFIDKKEVYTNGSELIQTFRVKQWEDHKQQENTDLKKQLEYLRSGEYLNQLKFERNMLEDIVQNMEVSKEDKEFIDMTHRNTELLEENQKLKKKYENAVADYEYEKSKNQRAIKNIKGLREKYFRMRVAGSNNDLSELIEILKEDNKEE